VSDLRLSWLGHPGISRDGDPVRLETRKTTAILAYVSLSGRPASRERLASVFWPDFDRERAPANLRRSLASIHASLPGDWLVSERETVSIRAEAGVWVDVRRLAVILSEVRGHGHNADTACAKCLAGLEEAARLFQGEFLEGFTLPSCPEFDDWQTAQREALRADLQWTLERLARAHSALAAWEPALAAARRWLALDRLHEPAQALVVRLLGLSGQRSAAIRQYEEYAKRLKDELGQEPDEPTRALYNSILSRQEGLNVTEYRDRPDAPAREPEEPRRRNAPPAGAFLGLLRTRLTIPQVRNGLVHRRRLGGLIEQGVSRGLLLVSAPAGFGKSTMLSEWALHAGMPVAWFSVDAGDNDLPQFLSYLAAACAGAVEGVGQDAAQLLRAMPPAPAEVIVTSLINDIEAAGRELALVLDDYQFIRAQEIHAAVRFLVEHRPQSLRVIVATREDPPLPLARLRSQAGLGEIRAKNLRFTVPEARQFLTRAMSLSLSAAQVHALEYRTEGWIAGLQMAALSLQGREDVDDFLESFGGTHRYVLDYLAEEVFSRQSAERQRFLLETSILGRMSAGLCEAVTGQPGTQETLEQLDRANLFLVPLDDQRGWYRYHHLFADLLRHRLARERAAEVIRGLHLRAGAWFECCGEVSDAIHEYLAAGAHARAAETIERSYRDILTRGGLVQLLRWCGEIPRKVSESTPGFCVAAGWSLGWAGRGKEAEEYLDLAEKQPLLDDALRGTIAISRAFIADLAGDTVRPVQLAFVAAELLPPTDFLARAIIPYIIGRSLRYQGDLANAEKSYSDYLRGARAARNIWSISGAVYEMVQVYRLQGRLRDALGLIGEFEKEADLCHACGTGPVAKTHAVKGELLREAGRLDEARTIVEEAVRQVDAWGLPSDVYVSHMYLARVLRSCGMAERARDELEKMHDLPQRALVYSSLYPAFEADRVRTLLALGDSASARALVTGPGFGKADTPVNREIEQVSAARVRIATDASREDRELTASLLERLTRQARSGCRTGPLMEILVLQAEAAFLRAAEEDAVRALEEALRLGLPEGYCRIFVEAGQPAVDLLRHMEPANALFS
jgi:LuxR family transcriptional regulator, maltose regulon positive regulatory protein